MIGYLSGEIVDIEVKHNKLTVCVNDIGYLVTVSVVLLGEYKIGDKIKLYIQPEIREDTFDLFGFLTTEEKLFYKKIRSVNGVGPRTALNILSMNLEDLHTAIEGENVKKLCSIPGLGKKTAERLILELKGNLPSMSSDEKTNDTTNRDVVQALMTLGYKEKEILSALDQIPDNLQEDQEIIKYFLKNNR